MTCAVEVKKDQEKKLKFVLMAVYLEKHCTKYGHCSVHVNSKKKYSYRCTLSVNISIKMRCIKHVSVYNF